MNLNYSTLPHAVPRRVLLGGRPDRRNFAPRAGLAWRLPKLPLPGGITVFRAGYGIYYSRRLRWRLTTWRSTALNIHNETQGNQPPVLTTRNGFAQTASTGFPSYFGVDPTAPTAYVQQWTAGFQHELPGRLLLETAYVASKGTHLGRFRQFNTPAHVEIGQDLPPRPGDLQSLRTFRI